MISDRLTPIRNILRKKQLTAIVFFGLPNIRYLCGFTGTDGVLILTDNNSTFLTDSRYEQQAQTEVIADKVICYKNKLKAINEQIWTGAAQRVGFDASSLSVAFFNELQETCTNKIDWVPLSDELSSLRSVKDGEEIIQLKTAATLNRQAFESVWPKIKPGVTEREISLELEFALKCLGGEANAFDFIVASGQRGALPHGVASSKKLTAGELVTIDFGTCVNGYYSDETVTIAIGNISGKLRQIFDIVLEAHGSALAAIRPGYSLRDLDNIARDLIRAKGYGEYFGHGLGHGVGLEIHEFPTVSPRSSSQLVPGMVITIEPGIYIPGFGGVRIEDTVVITETGFECLTSIPKGYREVSLQS